MNDYKPGNLTAMIRDGKLRNAQEVDEMLTLARQALARHAWDDMPQRISLYEADVCLLFDMQRYFREQAS